ncbi:hypothetical protein DRO02_06100 [archaeon]|nr:MAG: hypothetical protein DRN89_03885 [archaeon]RLG63674.1 MAG: hypothetical protein DRO21_05540 [archaeon]RLG63683.1 MAG: hypothetical protein DRO02_06100 [archaeon]
MKERTIIIGIGNPILGDDAAGLHVARILKKMIRGENVTIKESSEGSFDIVEEIIGFDKAIIVDTIQSENLPKGKIVKLTPNNLKENVHLVNLHDIDMMTALKIYEETMPEKLPREIIIYAITTDRSKAFSEKMSSEVENAVNKLAKTLLKEVSEVD